MRMIEVFDLMAECKIKRGTKLIIVSPSGKEYEYEYAIDIHNAHWSFVDDYDRGISYMVDITADTLQYEARLIEQKEKKYLIKMNVGGLIAPFGYLNYSREKDGVILSSINDYCYKTYFTKREMQSIQPVREFLADMKGKYELVEVEV